MVSSDFPEHDPPVITKSSVIMWLHCPRPSPNTHEVITKKPEENEIIKSGNTIVSIELEAESSGGADGNADCYYRIDNSGEALFSQTGGNVHKQELTQVLSGEHNLRVRCVDSANNGAEDSIRFRVETDTQNPKITRVYDDGGELVVVTDEPSTCAYSFNSCNFRVDEESVIGIRSASDGIVHSVSFDREKTYYIKCKDLYNNEKSTCDITATGGMF